MRHFPQVCVLLAVSILVSCGYHLAGHGDGRGAIPADVRTLSIQAAPASKAFVPLLRQRILTDPHGYSVLDMPTDPARHAVLRMTHKPERMVPVAYDAAGIATQYRLAVSGEITVLREGKLVWKSGMVTVQGDVFTTGGPASIEASRRRLADDLRDEWIRNVWARLRAGF